MRKKLRTKLRTHGASGKAELAFYLLPGVLTAFLGFSGGGFFAGTTGLVAIAIAAVLVLHALLADDPFAGIGRGVAVAACALGLYAVWTIASGWWSNAPARALLEFDRVLLYLLILVLFGSLPARPDRARWLVRGLAAGVAAVCMAGLVTRVLPDVFPTASNIVNERLSYPVTYWNSLGLLAAIGMICALHLTSDDGERPAVRSLAAGAMPLLAATLLLTFSRGAIAAGVVGLLAYGALARSRPLFGGLLATAPATAIAVIATYRSDRLFDPDPTVPAAVAQGHDLALILVLCAFGAARLRTLLLPLDRRVEWIRLTAERIRLTAARIGLTAPRRRAATAAAIAVAAMGIAAGSLVLEVPAWAGDQYERFVERDAVPRTGDVRERLISPSNNGRLEQWRVAFDAFADNPLAGNGAGTFQVLWAQHRRITFTTADGHSLYLESLAELGILGFVALAIALLAILTGLLRRARRARSSEQAVHAALFASALAWALHAGVDWDWEMPVVTLWLFAAGGAALAVPAQRRLPVTRPTRGLRVAVALGVLILAITPALAALSQDRLNDSVRALKRGDCPSAIDAALASSSAMGVRPEPYEILGYCDARLGVPRLGVRMLEQAVERDPDNWEFHYGLALVRGAAGFDPRAALREARRLNPREPLVRKAVERFATDAPAEWRKQARRTPLPID